MSRWFTASVDAEWTNIEGWGRDIACQLPLDALETTSYYYEAKGVSFYSRPGTDVRKGVLQWLRNVWQGTKLLQEEKVTSQMQLLTLHCPSVPGCRAKFGCESSGASEKGFQIEIIGFGGGTKHTSEYNETLLLSAEGRCVEIWMPVTYLVRKYQITRAPAVITERTFHTVDPVGMGEDVEVKPSACGSGGCTVVRSFDRPQQKFSLVPDSVLEKSIAYGVGSVATASVGVELPSLAKASLEARIVFNYKVSYWFELRGPGRFLAYEISYVPTQEGVEGQRLAMRRTLLKSPGYAWRWGPEAAD
jgi:hypothetical protein